MITIYYSYYSVKENKYKQAEKVFYSPITAVKFCWAMANKPMFLDGWKCDDIDDHEYMCRKVNMTKINLKGGRK